MDNAELALGEPLADDERAEALRLMRERGWAYTHRHPLTDAVLWSATDAGRLALPAL